MFRNRSFAEAYSALCDRLGVGDLSGVVTYRVSHEECDDRRNRLYFTSAYEDGVHVIKAYCHNCQLGAVDRVLDPVRPGAVLDAAVAREATEERDPPEVPDDIISVEHVSTPKAAQGYLRAYGLSDDDVNCSWSPSLGRIVFPIQDGPEYLGYIARSLPPVPPGVPKWITASGAVPLRTRVFRPIAEGSVDAVVFTEDLISAAVVAKAHPGAVGVPLFGLNIQPESILQHMRDYPSCRPVVWLDNDEASVRPRQRLTAVLAAFGYFPGTVTHLPDPKKVPHKEINKVLSSLVTS